MLQNLTAHPEEFLKALLQPWKLFLLILTGRINRQHQHASEYLLTENRVLRHKLGKNGIEEVVIAPHSPGQSPHVKRVIGTLRKECLDHFVVLGESHLRRIVRSYVRYYHGARTHLATENDAPELRTAQPAEKGCGLEIPEVGGLHLRYGRRAA